MTQASPASLRELDDSEMLNRAIALHYHDIAAAIARQGHGQSFALDVVHDLYLKLAARPEVLRDKRSIGAFLRRAAVNLCIDRFRRQNFEAALFSGSEAEVQAVAAERTAPEAGIEAQARLRLLRAAIAELPARRRAVFILNRLHRLPPDEIASRLGVSRNMVDRHLRKALAHCLHRLLQAD